MKKNQDGLGIRLYSKYIYRKLGIDLNISTGKIQYTKNKKMKIDCEAVYLLRHAHTIGTKEHKFMSDISENAHICKEGMLDILKLENCCDKYKFDTIIICSDIPRVRETATIFRIVNPYKKYIYMDKFKGINNAGWEGHDASTLSEENKKAYEEREIKNNIFAKSSKGESWNQVLLNCRKLIKYLNKHHKNERVLLIGQGSIIRGIEILIGSREKPWDDYDTKTLYNFEKQNKKDNYGTISCIIDEKEERNNERARI